VTFLFTDIEGSTRRWDQDPQTMRSALAVHDQVLRSAVERQGGFLFKHTGDGICAAFSSAPAAVTAAVAGQMGVELPVRMGLATGSADVRDGDYFGPVLNRAARVMAAGHGGQILLSGSTAGLIDGADLVDLGVHRLRDLSASEHLFQVRAPGLKTAFPSLRTLDVVPGNLPVQSTSFIGRQEEVKQVSELALAHRLVTLTGVGGVGKTRLALQAAAALVNDFPDGVWLVELAPVGDPSAIPDAVATTLGVNAQADRSMIESIAEALVGRRLLLFLDNCEHVLDVAAELVEVVLAGSMGVTILVTSREALRLGAEHVWAVPSLPVEGVASEAVELFVERATAVDSRFAMTDSAESDAVATICRRLDGIPLAIELAAARMVSMSAQEVSDRLGDRFRLLAGGRRGLERHQTLRQAVGWSYDLLSDGERFVLNRCAVFAGGFDLAAAAALCHLIDEYTALDILDSLVRKSMVNADRVHGRTRYWLLETIRQFGEEQLGATDNVLEVRDAHARYYASEAQSMWALWDGPGQRDTLIWADVELGNLRSGFRWASDRRDVTTATAIAAHATLLHFALAQWEPVGWAEELLPAAIEADPPQLPRLLVAAAASAMTGRQEGLGYAQAAQALEGNPRYEPFSLVWSHMFEAACEVLSGRHDEALSRMAETLASPDTFCRLHSRCLTLWILTGIGRSAEARAMADEVMELTRAHGNPYLIGSAMGLCQGRAYVEVDPIRALDAFREALSYSREHWDRYNEFYFAYEVAILEAAHGDIREALSLFDFTIDTWHRAGDGFNLPLALASLAMTFERLNRLDIAATLCGSITRMITTPAVVGFQESVERLKTVLGSAAFDQHAALGAAREAGEGVAYARDQIRLAREALQGVGDDYT
jgi:predicted ATPase